VLALRALRDAVAVPVTRDDTFGVVERAVVTDGRSFVARDTVSMVVRFDSRPVDRADETLLDDEERGFWGAIASAEPAAKKAAINAEIRKILFIEPFISFLS
jgi:hypothetical protein